jgi:anhydro-N-acetylmuramic acid kinase
MDMLTAIGLMSGTSMDGVDAAVLTTDGEVIGAFGPTLFRPYSPSERQVLRAALAEARGLEDRKARPAKVAEAEAIVTEAHIAAVRDLLGANPGLKADLVGFHGQTVFHAPDRLLTIQVGDGPKLAKALGLPVVYDFRAADMEFGGQGAPLVPVYHRALVRYAGLEGDVVVVNIGGVANITRISADGMLLAGDTGPGNALIDDFVNARRGLAYDDNGALAGTGMIDELALTALMADPWFEESFPKSLDRNAFSPAPVTLLGDADGTATLAAFTAFTIAGGISIAGGADTIVVGGGGAHNATLLFRLAEATRRPLLKASDLGWSGDFIEAQAFAFLAVRSMAGLPLSFPETTGVFEPMTGGVMARP